MVRGKEQAALPWGRGEKEKCSYTLHSVVGRGNREAKEQRPSIVVKRGAGIVNMWELLR